MARRLLRFAAIAAATAQQTQTTTTFQQGAKKEWTFGDNQYKYKIAGFTVETTCCVNKKAYKHDVDIPCNAAARRGVAVAVLVALVGVAIV